MSNLKLQMIRKIYLILPSKLIGYILDIYPLDTDYTHIKSVISVNFLKNTHRVIVTNKSYHFTKTIFTTFVTICL